jgi:predicted Zn-dependent protease
MTGVAPGGPAAAHRVADRLKVDGPWEVFAEEIQRYEVHLNGTTVELVRGPVALDGYSVRLLRGRGKTTGVGFQASTDFSEAGLKASVADAESIAKHSEFPASSVALPAAGTKPPEAEIRDRALWDDPARAVDEYLSVLRHAFADRPGASLSFGSVKTARVRTSLVNSAGLSFSYEHTLAQVEMAVKATGGPAGAAPGEYWVDESKRRLDTDRLAAAIDDWCRYAADVRRAVAPPSGELPVVLPPAVLAGIIPPVLGFRASGAAKLRKLGLEPGRQLGSELVTISDHGAYAWSPEAAPYDAEGAVSRVTPVVERGVVRSVVYDALHAAAFGEHSTGNGLRLGFGPRPWFTFTTPPTNACSTLVLAPGDGGSVAELCEAAGDGIWVQQLGWANPEAISAAFGGEIRIGYRIRHGKLAEPVRGGVVGGLVFAPPGSPSLLTSIAAVGRHAELSESLASPPVLVKPLTVAGGSA